MAHAGDSPIGSCNKCQQDLLLHHYGEPTEMEPLVVETHLERCISCRDFRDDLRRLLPITAKTDDVPEVFWESYSREMRQKLAFFDGKRSWWNSVVSPFRDWPVPALAALVAIAALTVTFGKGVWQPHPNSPESKVILEVQPVTEDLDFLKSLDFLDSLDLLEAVNTGKPKPQGA
jgi:hypothetical protein